MVKFEEYRARQIESQKSADATDDAFAKEAFLEASRTWGRLALTFARKELAATRNRVDGGQPPSEQDVQDQLRKLADALSMASA
jgi:hypothetical protein